MPTINNRNLDLIESGSNVTIDVTYSAVFSTFERTLTANGVVFEERITVGGVDPDPNPPYTIKYTFPSKNLSVTAGQGPQTINGHRSTTVPRKDLVEDVTIVHEPPNDPNGPTVAQFDDDEIRARIEIVPIGLPTITTGMTNQKVLEAYIPPPPSEGEL